MADFRYARNQVGRVRKSQEVVWVEADEQVIQDSIADLELLADDGEKLAVGNPMAFEVTGLALRTFGPAVSLADTSNSIGDVRLA